MNKFLITILKPGGNDTALVLRIPSVSYRKRINDMIMERFPNVEQVGFYECNQSKTIGRLEMAGGEFCGNATRSLAYLLLKGNFGRIRLYVSGTDRILIAGVKQKGTAFSKMPIRRSFNSVTQLSKNSWKVELDGITHVVMPKLTDVPKDELKNVAKNILSESNLLTTRKAAGVIFVSQKNNKKRIDPIVWVRDIQTLFYETACASGTIALALVESINQSENLYCEEIFQPSGMSITARVSKNTEYFLTGYIDGEIQNGGTYEI